LRRCLLQLICRQPVSPGSKTCFGDLPYAEMTSKAIRLLRDRRAHQPGAANNWLKALSSLYVWAIEAEHTTHNPVRDVPTIKSRSEGFHTWTVEEMRKYEAQHPIGTQARLAFALLAYTGQRRSDIIALGPQHVREGRLRFVQQKGKKRNPVTVEIPILPELARVIEVTPTGHLAFIVNSRGKQWSWGGFSHKFRDWCDEASLPHCSAHGMRKAAACAAAEGGASEMQMMAIFGWKTPDMARVYTRKANRGEMAAQSMHLLAKRQNEEQTNVSHRDIANVDGGKKRRKNL
jgi:integrase